MTMASIGDSASRETRRRAAVHASACHFAHVRDERVIFRQRPPIDRVGVDDLTFAARRAASGATARPDPELETRFRALVQSPLRAGILHFLSARADEAFDIEELMQTFGRMRQDVDNCVRELVEFGIVRRFNGDPPHLNTETEERHASHSAHR